jgi:hypothetical protein
MESGGTNQVNKPKVVAIHQPNLFPWLGFFDKMFKSDVFVFLDHVVNNPRTSIYTKRVKILANNQEYWLTVPLKSSAGITFQRIDEMEMDKPDLIAKKHLKTIELNYRKAPFFMEVFPLIAAFYNSDMASIASRNIAFIQAVAERTGIRKEFLRSSSMNCVGTSTDLLIEITTGLGGNVYLAGGGASGYQEDELFAKAGIQLSYQNFEHPVYLQMNGKGFTKGLSVLDMLMNCGFEKVAASYKSLN